MTPWPISSIILITLLVGYATLGLDNFVNRAPLLAFVAGLSGGDAMSTPEPSEGVRHQVGEGLRKSPEVESDEGFVNISLNDEQTDRESAEDPDHGFKMFDREYREEEHRGKGPKSSQ